MDGDEVPFQAGPLVQLVSAERQGKTYLPRFTDFQALLAYTQREVAGMGVPAVDAFGLALARFDGAVINPAHDALPSATPTTSCSASTGRHSSIGFGAPARRVNPRQTGVVRSTSKGSRGNG
jgi:hypothetical protein